MRVSKSNIRQGHSNRLLTRVKKQFGKNRLVLCESTNETRVQIGFMLKVLKIKVLLYISFT